MAYASRAGRARVSPSNPQALAVCQRCGIWYNHVDLQMQFQWQGNKLQNLQILVCRECLDIPQPQLRAIVIPADPLPIPNPRVEYFIQASNTYRGTYSAPTTDPITGLPIQQGLIRATQDGSYRIGQQTGEPPGGLNTEPGTSISVPDDIGGDDPGLPYQNVTVPRTGPLDQ